MAERDGPSGHRRVATPHPLAAAPVLLERWHPTEGYPSLPAIQALLCTNEATVTGLSRA
jgi:hypothetical protein